MKGSSPSVPGGGTPLKVTGSVFSTVFAGFPVGGRTR